MNRASTSRNSTVAEGIVVAVLLAVYAAASYSAAQTNAATWDEPLYIAAGTSYWRTNDYRLNPETGNWPQRIAGAWPACMAALPVDDPAQAEGYKQWRRANPIRFGKVFCYEWNDADAVLARSRAALLVVAVGLGATIYVWSRRLWGRWGGLLSLALFVTSPAMLAHATIAQSDMCVTLFSLLSLGATWRMLRRPTIVGVIVAGVVLAGAFLSKHSALLLLPTFVLLLALRTWHAWHKRAVGEPSCRTRRTLHTLGFGIGLLLLQGAVGIGVIWASYGFRYSAFPPQTSDGKFQADWDWALERRDTVTGTVELCREYRLLPEAFLYGTAFMHQRNTYRPGFLCDTYYESGTAWYLPYCWLLKTPPGQAAIVGLAALLFVHFAVRRPWRQTARVLYGTAPLWVFALLFAGVVVVSRFNTGDRYFFPIYAPLMILIGGVARYAVRRGAVTNGMRRALRICLSVAVGSAAVEAALAWPGYLSYVTPVVGGPNEGWHFLCDSSFDWGQDLTRVAPRISELQTDPTKKQNIYLGYFGTASPKYHGIDALALPRGARLEAPETLPPLEPGIYCVSVTELHRMYGTVCGPWTIDRERAYRGLRQIDAALAKASGARRDELLQRYPRVAAGYLQRDLADLEYARLCRYLVGRRPDARAGDTIFLYVLTAQDLRAALDQSL
ncbi:MAG: hypothetical protein C0483_01265 [Pirellula sp.]|nr:hypothetical protein [Pirellula sp.]